jgi:chromatin segregation and condensation protein Rec8/ScpA/Scc1 (kleisin family)
LPGKGLLDIYIPLLFLMSEGRVLLWQEEFFGEIFVQASGVGRPAGICYRRGFRRIIS